MEGRDSSRGPPHALTKWEALRDADKPGECEVRLRRFDGAFRSFLCRVEPLRYEGREAVRWYGTATDIEDPSVAEDLAAGEKRLLEMVTSGHSTAGNTRNALSVCRKHDQSGVTAALCWSIRAARVLTRGGAEPSGQLRHLHVGRPLNADSGPCAMAAYLNEQVIAADLTTETRWAAYEWCPMALAHGVRACWSTPISSSAGTVLGAFAIYYPEPKAPTPLDQAIIDQFTHIASITVERQRSQEALTSALDEIRRSEAKLRQVIDTIPTLAWCNLSDGPNEFLNKKWHEYTGLSTKNRMVGVGKLRSIPRTCRH